MSQINKEKKFWEWFAEADRREICEKFDVEKRSLLAVTMSSVIEAVKNDLVADYPTCDGCQEYFEEDDLMEIENQNSRLFGQKFCTDCWDDDYENDQRGE